MNQIQFLTIPGCHNCEAAKKIFDEVMPEFKDRFEVKEFDMTAPDGQELMQKYGVMASPGIIINDELFSTGGVSKEKLLEKLRAL